MEISHKSMKFVVLMSFLVIFLAQSTFARDCEDSISFTQLTKEAVCDGSPFTIRLENKNGWSGYEEVIFSPSEGINFNTFPHVMFSDKNAIDMVILCKDIERGFIDANIMGNENTCSIRLNLESIFKPIKNGNGEIVVTGIDNIKKTQEKDRFFRNVGIALTAAFIIAAIILIRYISHVRKNKKHLHRAKK